MMGALLFITMSLVPLGLIIDGLNTGSLIMLGMRGKYSRSNDPVWFWLSIAVYAVAIGWCWYTAAKSITA